jgi:hypothetical protein
MTAAMVEHRDRLGRVTTEWVESALAASGRRLVVLDAGDVDDGLVRDMVEVMTSFCARLYGRRSARNPGVEGAGIRAARHGGQGGGWCRKLSVSSVRMWACQVQGREGDRQSRFVEGL